MSRRKPRRESREPACITADAQSVNAVLLHLAAAVVKRKDPALFAELAEDLETRHCSARACWKKLFNRQVTLLERRSDMVSLILAKRLADQVVSDVCVADPESGPEPIGYILSWREAYPAPARPVEDGELRVSSLAVLSKDEEVYLEPEASPLMLVWEVEKTPVLRVVPGAGIPAFEYGNGPARIALFRLEEGTTVETKFTLQACMEDGDLLVRLSPEVMMHMMAFEGGILRLSCPGGSWHSRVPVPGGEPVTAVIDDLAGRFEADVWVSARLLGRMRVHCPWLGQTCSEELIGEALAAG